jgi:hypothetical protein
MARRPIVNSFPGSTLQSELETERQRRLANGAVTCTFVRNGEQWIMTTEWSSFGEVIPDSGAIPDSKM